MRPVPIPFGKPFPTVDPMELRDGIASILLNGWTNRLGDYPKRPGLTLRTTLPSGSPIDGIYENNTGIVLVVSGGRVYELSSNGQVTGYSGQFLNVGVPVSFAEDSVAVYAANGGKIQKINTNTKTISTVSNGPDSVTSIVWILGYLIANGFRQGGLPGDVNTASDPENGYNTSTSWDRSGGGGSFNNESHPDGCDVIWTDFEEVYSGGASSIEVSWNDGTTPWAKIPGVSVRRGVIAPYSVVQFDKSYMFLSKIDSAPRIVAVAATGRQPEPVSNPYDSVLQTLSDFFNARAWGFSWLGERFYLITFPGDGFSICYSVDQNMWSQWGFWNGTQNESHLMNCYLYSETHNRHYVGDRRATGNVYTMGGFTDDGTMIDYQLVSGHISHGTDTRKICRRLRPKIKKGQASDTSEPMFTLEIRKDNLRRFGKPKTLSLGFANETEMFGNLTNLGQYRTHQYKIRHQDIHSDFIFASLEETLEICES